MGDTRGAFRGAQTNVENILGALALFID